MTGSAGNAIVDQALDLAVEQLMKLGLPKDEAHIALLIRLWDVVPENIVNVAKMLSEDSEVAEAINDRNGFDQKMVGA